MLRLSLLSLSLACTLLSFGQTTQEDHGKSSKSPEYKYTTTIKRNTSKILEVGYTESLKGGILFLTKACTDSPNKAPIIVSLSNFDTTYSRTTDSRGFAQFQIPYGFYKAHVGGEGYQPIDTTVNVDCGLKTFIKINLGSSYYPNLLVNSTYELGIEDIAQIQFMDHTNFSLNPKDRKKSRTTWKGIAKWEEDK